MWKPRDASLKPTVADHHFNPLPGIVHIGPKTTPMDRPSRQGSGIITVLALLGLVAALLVVIVPKLIRPEGAGQYSACQTNIRHLALASQMYAVDWGGHYPESTAFLTPNYLKTIPMCPASGTDTYTASWTLKDKSPGAVECPGHISTFSQECTEARKRLREHLQAEGSEDKLGQVDAEWKTCPVTGETFQPSPGPKTLEFCCQSADHPKEVTEPNYPQYSSELGLLEKRNF